MELFGLCTVSFLITICYAEDVSVTSNVGIIKGLSESVTYAGRTSNVFKFLGIPYAEPPIGDLRFARPVKKSRFNQPFSALQYGSSCPQKSLLPNQSEDCLYLNVFSPNLNIVPRLPVMIFIHGGGFVFGSSSQYGGERLAAYGQVVLVTINYRLGPLGFLNVNNKNLIQPNNGLMDQHMAMKWVHDNIQSFGGDPSKVTLFGESAGSASAIFQTLYPPNDGLFHRVIAQSGTASSIWAVSPDPRLMARRLAIEMKCPVTSILEMVRCFKQYNDTTKMIMSVKEGDLWAPTYDDEFVFKSHIDELRYPTGNISLPLFEKVDLLMGTNGFEGHSSLIQDVESANIYRNMSYGIDVIKEINKNVILNILNLMLGNNITNVILDDVMFQYSNFRAPQNRDEHIIEAVMFLTDLFFVPSTQSSIMRHVHMNTLSKTFQYEYNEIYPLVQHDSWVQGATHASELAYIFGFPAGLSVLYGNYNDSITRVLWPFSSKVMEYWTNFAKNGNPNGGNLTNWPEYNAMEEEYLYITSNKIESRHNLHARRVKFWNQRVPMLIERMEKQQPSPNVECTSSASFIFINLQTFIMFMGFYMYMLLIYKSV